MKKIRFGILSEHTQLHLSTSHKHKKTCKFDTLFLKKEELLVEICHPLYIWMDLFLRCKEEILSPHFFDYIISDALFGPQKIPFPDTFLLSLFRLMVSRATLGSGRMNVSRGGTTEIVFVPLIRILNEKSGG